jgi:hypothetical protein
LSLTTPPIELCANATDAKRKAKLQSITNLRNMAYLLEIEAQVLAPFVVGSDVLGISAGEGNTVTQHNVLSLGR